MKYKSISVAYMMFHVMLRRAINCIYLVTFMNNVSQDRITYTKTRKRIERAGRFDRRRHLKRRWDSVEPAWAQAWPDLFQIRQASANQSTSVSGALAAEPGAQNGTS
jgi:hypothetical protein